MDSKPRVIPPVYLLAGLVLIVILDRQLPVRELLSPPAAYIGLVPVALGLLLSFIAVARFRRVGTGVVPGSEATVLVQDGPFRFTRNPMYLGMTLILFGMALVFGSLSPLFVPPLFFVLMDVLFVRKEERWMEEAFGAEYVLYKRGTRRWL